MAGAREGWSEDGQPAAGSHRASVGREEGLGFRAACAGEL